MNIEPNTYYKTRNGKLVHVVAVDTKPVAGGETIQGYFTEQADYNRPWFADGHWLKYIQHEFDLVERAVHP